MRPRVFAWMLIVTLAMAFVAGGTLHDWALADDGDAQRVLQAATPRPAERDELAPGVELTELAAGVAAELPEAPATLLLERLVPATRANQQTAAGPEVLLVERGTVEFADEFGIGAELPAGEAIFLPAGSVYELRAVGGAPAAVLRLRLSDAAAVTANAAPATAATPRAATSTGAAAETLLSRELETGELPAAPARLILGRLTLAPGAELAAHTSPGPIGLLVETGTLTIAGPSGVEGELAEGEALIFPGDVQNSLRNAGNDEVTVLVSALIPDGAALIDFPEVPTPTPTNTPAPTATSIPTSTATPSPTLEPTSTPEPTATSTPVPTSTAVPTPTPVPPADTVLYQADWSAGLDGWNASPAWKAVGGMLVNDGSDNNLGDNPPVTEALAPFATSGLSDYAIEAEIQLIRVQIDLDDNNNDCASFGLIGRDSDAGNYFAGWFQCDDYYNTPAEWKNPNLGVTGGGDLLSSILFGPGDTWHTYRVEFRGNQIRVLVDGNPLLEIVDNQFLDGGQVGLFSDSVQVNVRNFRVISLGPAAVAEADAAVAVSPGQPLYEADWSNGLNGWVGNPDWEVVDGVLTNEGTNRPASNYDGTTGSPLRLWAPFKAGDLSDYAIEAEIQLVRVQIDLERNDNDCASFGVQGRRTAAGNYFAGWFWCDEYYDTPNEWQEPNATIQGGGNVLALAPFDPGADWHLYRAEFEGNTVRLYIDGTLMVETVDNQFLEGGKVTLAVDAAQVNVRRFGVYALGGDRAARAVGGISATQSGDSNGITSVASIADLLPAAAEIPGGLLQTTEVSRTGAELAAISLYPAALPGLLAEWGWTGNTMRAFTKPGGVAGGEVEATYVEVSVHSFANPTGASAALQFWVQEQLDIGLVEIPIEPLGDEARAVAGPALVSEVMPAGATEVSLYARHSGFVIRVSAVSPAGDPTNAALSVMTAVLAR